MLAKQNRLTKKGSFAYLHVHGERSPEKKVKLNYVRSKSGVRIGFLVSNKIGHAVVRNKVKRRMRAVMREFIDRLYPCQAVFVVVPGVDKLDFCELRRQMTSCLTRANLIKE